MIIWQVEIKFQWVNLSFFRFNTGLIQENMTERKRQKNYDADITYVTNR